MMERKAYTAFGEMGFVKMGFGETGRHHAYTFLLTKIPALFTVHEKPHCMSYRY